MIKLKVLCVFGTRPEAIKFAPVIRALRSERSISTTVCITSQHNELLSQALEMFDVKCDIDLHVMVPNQGLLHTTTEVMNRLSDTLNDLRPDWVLVQGDATSAFAAALSAFYSRSKIGHIEAGLRTWDRSAPYPEEFNRRAISIVADAHFAPTALAKDNLLRERIRAERIWITGNTGIDSLLLVLHKIESNSTLSHNLMKTFSYLDPKKKLILVTAHRRESFGQVFEEICLALRDIVKLESDVQLIYQVHLNPNILASIHRVFGDVPGRGGANAFSPLENLFLVEPLDYASIVYLLRTCYFVITDSGGLQEEAPTLGKPVLVMREVTERTEGVVSGVAKLVGRTRHGITNAARQLIEDEKAYTRMAKPIKLYGDGRAAQKIVGILREQCGKL